MCCLTLPCPYGPSLVSHSLKAARPQSTSPAQSERVLQAGVSLPSRRWLFSPFTQNRARLGTMMHSGAQTPPCFTSLNFLPNVLRHLTEKQMLSLEGVPTRREGTGRPKIFHGKRGSGQFVIINGVSPNGNGQRPQPSEKSLPPPSHDLPHNCSWEQPQHGAAGGKPGNLLQLRHPDCPPTGHSTISAHSALRAISCTFGRYRVAPAGGHML